MLTTAAAIEDLGRSSVPGTGHVGHESVASEFTARVLDRFGRVDVLVNGAGGMRTADGLYYERSFEELTEDELDEVFRNNVKSAFFMCRSVGPAMLEQGRGSVINVSSNSGVEPSPGRIPYGVSKAGVTNFTKSLAAEWGPRGGRVNEIMPMAVTRPQEARYQDAENVERVTSRAPCFGASAGPKIMSARRSSLRLTPASGFAAPLCVATAAGCEPEHGRARVVDPEGPGTQNTLGTNHGGQTHIVARSLRKGAQPCA